LKILIPASCCAFVLAGALSAQTVSLLDRFAFNVGGGIDETLMSTHKNLAGGWNVQAGLGYNFTPHLGIMFETEYDRLRITDTALNTLGTPQAFPGGKVRSESVTLNPTWHFHPRGSWDVYVMGGGGAYQRLQQLSAPIVATATGTNAFFGFNTPGYPASGINLDYTVNKPGVDVAAGISWKVKWNFKAYAEVRYNHVFMGSLGHMDYVPVSIGVRW
jgi:opacity protein-like surface antigen